MASINNPLNNQNEDENQQNGAGPQQISNGQQATVGATGAAPAQGTKSGRFTNISNYLRANNNYNASGGGLAGKVAGNIQGQAEQVKNDTNAAQTNFKSQAEQNRVGYDENTVNNAVNNSAEFAKDDNNVNKFQTMLNAKYNGPQQIQDVNALQNKAQGVQDLANQSGSEAGRFGLLKTMFNKPSYTGGQQRLDNLLLQGNQGQLKQLTGTRALGGQAVNAVNNAQQDAIGTAQMAKDEAAATAAKTQEQLNSGISGFDNSLNDRLQKAESDRQNQYAQMLRDADQGKLNGVLGADNLMGRETYGVNLRDYIKNNSLAGTKQGVATDADYARAAALSKLSGGNLQGNSSSILDSYKDPSQAGSFARDTKFDFDPNAVDAAINQNRKSYETALDPINVEMGQASTWLGQNPLDTTYGNFARDYLNEDGTTNQNDWLRRSAEQYGLGDLSGKSNEDVLRAYASLNAGMNSGENDDNTAGQIKQYIDSVDANKNKLARNQDKFAKLKQQFKIGQTIGQAKNPGDAVEHGDGSGVGDAPLILT